jgi:hypothetical protein
MTLDYTRDERGARIFHAGGRRFRAFWLQCGHEWSIRELDANGDRMPGRAWKQKNWPAVERFVMWLVSMPPIQERVF